MSYFKNFPTIDYEFPDEIIRTYKNISIRPAVIEAVKTDYSNLESYTIQDKDTPETLAFDYYGDPAYNWAIMLVNDIVNIYNDWPLTERALDLYLLEKYRFQKDSDGVLRELTDEQVGEFIEFVGTTTNNFRSHINLQDSDNSPKILLRPHHFIDEFSNYYTVDSQANNIDAFERIIDLPELFPVSYKTWEGDLNDVKREIIIPSTLVVKKMEQELEEIVND